MMASKSFIFRFSEFEARERELRLTRAGDPVPVEPKAFRVLVCLLRTPGKVVLKEELLRAVWGEVAVQDNSLTRAIALLRKVLSDDPHNPRYIETVSTVGYRFVCGVEAVDDYSANAEAQPVGGNGKEAVAPDQIPVVPPAPPISTRHARRRWWLALGATGVAAILGIGIWYVRRPLPPPRITEYVRITNDGWKKRPVGTDGNRLYMEVQEPHEIAQVPISGGQIAQVPIDLPNPSGAKGLWDDVTNLVAVSPDGSSLLVANNRSNGRTSDMSVVGVLGHPARYLTKAVDAQWSADGKFVVYSTAHGDLYIIPSEGGKPRLFIASPAPPGEDLFTSAPQWSPDGRLIRFDRDKTIWEASSNGAYLHPLLPRWHTSSVNCCGSWTPDGEFYLFLSQVPRFVGGSQLWAIDERHGRLRPPIAQPVQLTPGPIEWSDPIPSRDGQRIFARGVDLRGDLVRYESQSKQMQLYLGGVSAEFVSFSKDGKSVAYVSFPDGILWRANRDGSGLVPLTNPPFYPVNPRWSPDGTQIVFADNSLTSVKAIWVVSSRGGIPARVLPEDNGSQGDPNWSPDGKKMVYDSTPASGVGWHRTELRVLDLASHKVTTLPDSDGRWSPRWSPDGRYIAAIGSTGGIDVFDLEAQQWTTVQKTILEWPTWSQDSRWIYFLRIWDSPGVFRVSVKGGQAERVVDLKGFRHTGRLSHWLGLDPNDSPMLLRDAGTDEIYALTLERK